MTTPKQTILYARFSPRPNARECESIQTQFERLRQWAAALGLEIIGEYFDEDKSGKTTNGRPGLAEAIRHACKAHAILAVYSLSRLARNTRDAIEIADRLAKHKADLASLHERIDTSSSWGKFFYTLTAAFAQLEREQIVERTSDAMRRHQSSGRRMGRIDRCPYGFKPADENPAILVPSTEEAAIVERIKAIRTEGATYRAICRRLDEEGLRRRGQQWNGAHRLVKSILQRQGCD